MISSRNELYNVGEKMYTVIKSVLNEGQSGYRYSRTKEIKKVYTNSLSAIFLGRSDYNNARTKFTMLLSGIKTNKYWLADFIRWCICFD